MDVLICGTSGEISSNIFDCFYIYLSLITSVLIAHRRNKIVLEVKLLPSLAFPVDGKSAEL